MEENKKKEDEMHKKNWIKFPQGSLHFIESQRDITDDHPQVIIVIQNLIFYNIFKKFQ